MGNRGGNEGTGDGAKRVEMVKEVWDGGLEG